MRILIIDDNEWFYFLYRSKLVPRLRPILEFASNLEAGVEMSSQNEYDLILVSESQVSSKNQSLLKHLSENCRKAAVVVSGRMPKARSEIIETHAWPVIDKSINATDFTEEVLRLGMANTNGNGFHKPEKEKVHAAGD